MGLAFRKRLAKATTAKRVGIVLPPGIGATVASHRYRVQDHEFSTRFNFASHLGLGRNFGAQRQHELMLSVQHVSNAGIKSPNPGENFLQLRYALHF